MNDDFVGVSREWTEAMLRAFGVDVLASKSTPAQLPADWWPAGEDNQDEMREFWQRTHDPRRAGLKPVVEVRAGDLAGMTPEQIEQRLRDLSAASGRGE